MKKALCGSLLLMCVALIATVAQADTAPTRTLTFSNQCPYDVWLTAVGSNASNVPCTPSSSNAQGDCASGNICFDKNANTHYCVAGTTTSKQFPITQASNITLTPSGCSSGQQVTNTGSVLWGQCTCNSDSDCASGQVCSTVQKGIKQCYWGYNLPQGGKLAADTGTAKTLSLSVTANSTDPNAVVSSGKFFVKLACDANGTCQSDNTQGAPASLVEFTFKNNNDWYDVSYINGINAPMAMYPVTSKSNDYDSKNPYRCQAAGADKTLYDSINTFQTNHGLTPNTALEKFVCTNDYDTSLGTSKVGFNFVSAVNGAKACTQNSQCSSGQVCGLTLSAVTGNKTATQCGNRLGFWTYAQFCGANSSYKNVGLGIRCDKKADMAYALCKNQSGLGDTGPGRSCFNANTTSSGDTCCGYKAWTLAGTQTVQPMAPGDAAVQGVNTTTWTNAVMPAVQSIKQGCYLAYSFQYDDPYSTFTCASKSGLNKVNYKIDLCPNGAHAGINPPSQGTCTATVPQGYEAANFTVPPPSGVTLTINACNAQGNNCTTAMPQTPSGSKIYTAKNGSLTYLITATNGSKATQSCKFVIPDSGCIQRLDFSGDCSNWQVAQDGAWQNRAVQIPSF